MKTLVLVFGILFACVACTGKSESAADSTANAENTVVVDSMVVDSIMVDSAEAE